MFIFGDGKFHSRRRWYETPVPKTGARKCSQFMVLVSGVCVIGNKLFQSIIQCVVEKEHLCIYL